MSEVLDFDKQNGLITAVVQDAKTHRVLMVGYMNREAFDKTSPVVTSPSSAARARSSGPKAKVPGIT
jgi:phosphoribosyl-AMP cyclohydrolase